MFDFVGRSSSHFTRLARIFLLESGVEFQLLPVHDLMALDAASYGHHPALKLPVLITPDGPLFGSLPICRKVVSVGERPLKALWPEDLQNSLASNAQEIVTQTMATQVTVILCRLNHVDEGNPMRAKAEASLVGSVEWLDREIPTVLRELPSRDLSFLEAGLFCLYRHLEFRQTMDPVPYSNLADFCADFGQRDSAKATEYGFD